MHVPFNNLIQFFRTEGNFKRELQDIRIGP